MYLHEVKFPARRKTWSNSNSYMDEAGQFYFAGAAEPSVRVAMWELQANDWETLPPKTVDANTAFKAMQNGLAIYRSTWPLGHFIKLYTNGIVTVPTCFWGEGGSEHGNWFPTIVDLTATDWIIGYPDER